MQDTSEDNRGSILDEMCMGENVECDQNTLKPDAQLGNTGIKVTDLCFLSKRRAHFRTKASLISDSF